MTHCRYYILLFLGILSCSNPPIKESSPTAGEIHIQCDEALSTIIEQEKDIFERNYPYAKIHINYLSEFDLFRNFLNDSAEVIIASRSLMADEREFLDKNRNLHPREFPFAVSALAFISSPQSHDSCISYEDLVEALTNNNSEHSKSYIIENAQSGIPQYLMHLGKLDRLPSNFYAQKNTNELIQYVLEHQGSIGILDWSRMSDSDDPYAKAILDKVQLLSVRQPKDSMNEQFYRPYQYNLQDRKYPFTRDLVFISRTGKNDLGLGFASFITGEIGQRILLKAGLLPLFQTDRWIELKTSGSQRVVR